ncbi:glycerophosphodiester phosphodiesterase [Knoellia sp. S7-12]|uniref:glycerophosphodiester phosphodiesterase n=1 Tax=Knoellia sp. S7-12 TaxID=3126698 RepID=UPI0033661D54
MRRRRLLPVLLSAATLTLGVGLAPAVAAEPPQNPWLEQRVLNMAHSGGEDEAPMNTMYAFRRAVALGSDMIELDVQSTADGELVVMHNATVDETTNGTGRVLDKTLDEVKELDAAHWFVPGRSAVHGLDPSAYPLRGARFGRPRVEGFKPKDFMVPTLREVLKAFPATPINIEIKGTSDADTASFIRTGTLLAQLLNKNGRTDLIVGSFNDTALADFHSRAPQVPMSAGRDAMINYFLGGVKPPAGVVAFQVPVTFAGIPVATPEFVARAHRDGYAVHVWFSGSAPDDAPTYNRIIDTGADGIMPAKPTLLESILDERGIERP